MPVDKTFIDLAGLCSIIRGLNMGSPYPEKKPFSIGRDGTIFKTTEFNDAYNDYCSYFFKPNEYLSRTLTKIQQGLVSKGMYFFMYLAYCVENGDIDALRQVEPYADSNYLQMGYALALADIALGIGTDVPYQATKKMFNDVTTLYNAIKKYDIKVLEGYFDTLENFQKRIDDLLTIRSNEYEEVV